MSTPVRWLLGLFAAMAFTLLVPIACRRVEPYEAESGPITYGSGLTAKPNSPTHFKAAVLDRRKTSFVTSWTAPSDAYGNAVAAYKPLIIRGCADCIVDAGSVGACTPTYDGGQDGGLCACNGYPGCMPSSWTFSQAVDAGVTVCQGIWTRTPVKPGQQETWTTNEGVVCPPDGGSGYAQ